jgi:hypothetical protein
MAEGDKKALSLGDAVNAAFHPDVEFFRFFEGVPVFEDIDFGFLVDIVFLDRDLFDDVDEVFVDLRENTVFIEGFGSPEDPLSLVHRSEVFEDHVSHAVLSRALDSPVHIKNEPSCLSFLLFLLTATRQML